MDKGLTLVLKHNNSNNNNKHTSLAEPGALAHRLQNLTARWIQNGRRGLEMGQTLSLWTFQSTFAKLVFLFDHSFYENLNQNGHQGAPKWLTRSGKGSTPQFLGAPINFRKTSFLIWALLLFKKVMTDEKKWKKNL